MQAGTNKGLPGYLTAMDISYDNSVWSITKDKKVPHHFEVSLGFTALHEFNPGLYKDPSSKTIKFGAASISKEGKIENVSEEAIRKIFKSVKDAV